MYMYIAYIFFFFFKYFSGAKVNNIPAIPNENINVPNKERQNVNFNEESDDEELKELIGEMT
ncbi:hypothetical protein PFMALIP_03989 [Plasmodium falciparum MaliPS096_E11]|uniref:Uncharacterized protein n=1 Tax=Plasmodium falciparum MaliPS096_E11 TaxID=1036727 RepID=A0A024WL45_PLAFA|nr:hypothetical protein PFMALIP_03989 [Plasmodium falciparum MaliPS096_E11]